MRRLLLSIMVVGLTFASFVARAADPVAYTQAAFEAAQAQGKPILVEVHAPWCPTCAKQRPILSELQRSADFSDLVVFNVDFDSQKDALRALNVQQQSTLIVFSGKTERGRSTGVTDPAEIKALLQRAKAT